MSREQCPLILAYGITIHKCQGISLNCALIDLSDEIFSPGMVYVALSRVRTLEGLHLTAFTPKSVRVSTQSLQEINQLHSLYGPDLPPYAVPNRQGKSIHSLALVQFLAPKQCKGSRKSAQTGLLPSTSNSTSLPVPQSVTHTVVWKGSIPISNISTTCKARSIPNTYICSFKQDMVRMEVYALLHYMHGVMTQDAKTQIS